MAIKKVAGHAVTGVLPSNSDASSVGKVNLVFPQAPANQSGGTGSKGVAKVNPTGKGKKAQFNGWLSSCKAQETSTCHGSLWT